MGLAPPQRRAISCLVFAIALVPALAKLLCYPHNIGSDDAYIHLRIATNFIHGLGWGINPHQPVNLSTSPAFTLLLAGMEVLTSHAIGVTQVLSAGAVIAGLVFIFMTAQAETNSLFAALFAETAAAFSVELWRWNGALMEASFAFAVVSIILYLFRAEASDTLPRLAAAGVALGIGMLLRPEMGLLLLFALMVQWRRSTRIHDVLILLLGAVTVILPWCVFAYREMASVIPTTFAAKSTTHLILWNKHIIEQFGDSIVGSILFPALLILFLLLRTRGSSAGRAQAKGSWLPYFIPTGWIVGLFTFYYLKTHGLQSTGRYVLPLLPCEVLLLALAWKHVEAFLTPAQGRFAQACVGMHILFSLGLNYTIVMPVLQRFEPEYGATMRAAADELAQRIETSPNHRVLVEEDIGVLSCTANGRFEILDGGALATPALHGLSVREQIERVQPAFVLQSLSSSSAGFGPNYADLLAEVWKRRFRQHSVRGGPPYLYAILYQEQEGSVASARH